MARRYSNINQGTELKKAQDALEEYRKTRITKRGNPAIPTVGKSRPKEEVAIKPFDTSIPPLILVSVVRASLTKLKPKLTEYIKNDTTSLFNATTVKGFRAARIHYFEPTSDTRTYVASKQTGLNYIKYPGESYSCPFGCVTDTQEEAAIARIVKRSVLEIDTAKDYRRAWYESERVRV